MKTEDPIEGLGEVAGEVPPDSSRPARGNGAADEERECWAPAFSDESLHWRLPNNTQPAFATLPNGRGG